MFQQVTITRKVKVHHCGCTSRISLRNATLSEGDGLFWKVLSYQTNTLVPHPVNPSPHVTMPFWLQSKPDIHEILRSSKYSQQAKTKTKGPNAGRVPKPSSINRRCCTRLKDSGSNPEPTTQTPSHGRSEARLSIICDSGYH